MGRDRERERLERCAQRTKRDEEDVLLFVKSLRRSTLRDVQLLPTNRRVRTLQVRFTLRRFARRDAKFRRPRGFRSPAERGTRDANATVKTSHGFKHETYLLGEF